MGGIIMIQFNLKEYLKNPKRKVITRNGEDVRIICTDKKKAVRPLIALITKDDGTEYLQTYQPNGRIGEAINYIDDLFFDTEKHEGWINLYKINSSISPGPLTYNTKKEAESATGNRPDYISTIKIEWEE